MDREDVTTIIGALFDLNVKVDEILVLLREDEHEEEEE